MKNKSVRNWQEFKLEKTLSERISHSLPWITVATIFLLIIAVFGIGNRVGMLFSDQITFFLSSVIALFAFVESISNSVKVTREKNKIRLKAIEDMLEKVYAPLYSVFSKKWTYTHEKNIIIMNKVDKEKIDTIIRSHPFLVKPIILRIWRITIERLKPCEPDKSAPVFALPAYFLSHITIEYDQLTDEYHKRTGMDMSKESSFWQRIDRLPDDEEKTYREIVESEQFKVRNQ